MARWKPMTDAEIMADLKRRHSPLHKIDHACVKALTAVKAVIPIAVDHGLAAELNAVRDALVTLNDAAKAKWETTK
jgi:hypothetical protein